MSNDVPDSVLDRAHDHAQRYLHGLAARHVGARAERDEMMAALHEPLSTLGEDDSSVIDLLAGQAETGMTDCGSPRYFGFVIGGAHPVALAADWLVSTWDQNAGIHAISPFSAAVEEVAAEWLLDLFGLPNDASVGFVTGGQMANFTCLAAARHAVLRRVGWDVELDGLAGAPRVTVVVSAATHVTIDVALRYLGFGTRSLVTVDADDQGRMRADSLRDALATVGGPVIICAQAGNVNSGACDPLREIAEIANEMDAWLHVDGAFGLWARASAELVPLVDGIEKADSWSTDAHKWLNVPYDSGVAIVKHAADHRAAMSASAAYLIQTSGAERDAIDWVPELSRRARAIPIYATVRALGRKGIDDVISRSCRRARQMASILQSAEGVDVLNDVVLNQALVRFADSDDVTRAVVTGVQAEGTCWVSGTTWNGHAAMRVSVTNWATSEHDIELSAAAILKVYGVELHNRIH
ncbi:glutamate/tyrosine decarboxylase-like PLP-dependent enzyme [Salinibacterium amurskyense]|uniref:Glutamate/tyrosine decarboxylase-like PLP-dependent enzyme n=1 Tax=Salinibacterium amurskyense TaxID=205941 RepID=A0A2M9D9T8_9MICO|nr:aminotransferase class V-fold PLP-dependent enzyme [Salinibacterium amurskyense]PJJ82243.1 glutamate/tyrosine decarboxylase-like PLP-dependent enzyme [Salinibacterium amurskyense]RLQ82009.1 aspartate aminotransferase family protein [Salinibacterium amurskyense]GHD77643.1 aspartate aminotransferase family protein [Salinibacterium amurskyense]